MIYESAQEFLKRKVASGKPVKLAQLRKEVSGLKSQRIDLAAKSDAFRQEQKGLEQAKKNIEIIMNPRDKDKDKGKREKYVIESW